MNDRPGKRSKLFHSLSRISRPPPSSTQGASTSAAAAAEEQNTSNQLHPSSAPSATHLPKPMLNNPAAPNSAAPPVTTHNAISERWAGLRRISNLLINGPVIFGPLKQATEGLLSLVETFEREAESREDYRMLRIKLDKIFHSLAGFLGASVPPAMTSAIADLARGIDQELGLIRQQQERTRINKHMHAGADADEVLKHYRVIQGLLEDFMLNASMSMWQTVDDQATEHRLSRLPNSPAAKYNSAESENLLRGGCISNTRVQVLDEMYDWACDAKSEKIYWLNGMAGTGKTTIAYSLCERLDGSKQLAASFFCSRQLPTCRDVNRIVPTIAYQLSRFSRPFRSAISEVLEQDPDVHNQPLVDQFQHLIVEPLNQTRDDTQANLVVVIDALDECDDNNGVDLALGALLSSTRDLPIRFFVTSRPDANILDRMHGQGDRIPPELRLHELERIVVQADIRTYLTSRLGSRMKLSEENVNALAERSGVLFIYAATLARWIESDNFSRAAKRLEGILGASSGSSRDISKDIDGLYTAILDVAFNNDALSDSDRAEMRQVMHAVVCAQEPLAVDTMADLLRLDSEAVHAALRPLRSVLHVSDGAHIVTTLHESFPDYILDEERSKVYHCNAKENHQHLARSCFDQMKAPNPPFNICKLESSYMFDDDIPDLPARVKRSISNALLYACRYWVAHLMLAQSPGDLAGILFEFLSLRFLLWMEVMNLSKHIHDGIKMLYRVQMWSMSIGVLNGETEQLLSDAWRFIVSFFSSPASRSTPHIYISALSFWPDQHPVTNLYRPHRAPIIDGASTAMSLRKATPLATIKTGHGITSLAYSPDGSSILSFGDSEDYVIYVWDALTGQPVGQPLEGHADSVECATYSPDGAYIASGSRDRTVRIWNARTGQPLGQPLVAHTNIVTSVGYSPDGSRIVSGSVGGVVCIWDARSGLVVGQPLRPDTEYGVESVAYSPNGTRIICRCPSVINIWDADTCQLLVDQTSGDPTGCSSFLAVSPDGTRAIISLGPTAALWDVQTGQTTGRLLPNVSEHPTTITYSPDSTYMISWSRNDTTLSPWDAQTGKPIGQPLEDHNGYVNAACFSPDGAYIITGSEEGAINIWDAHVACQQTSQALAGYSLGVRSVVYSPDGAYIASASDDRTIRIWDAQTLHLVGQPLKGHTDSVISLVYSPDGAYIVSGSRDTTIRIWNAQTAQPVGRPLKRHNEYVRSVAYSPDGSHIVSGSGDCTVHIWDARTGQFVEQLVRGYVDPVISVAYTPNGAYIVSISNHGTVRTWNVQTQLSTSRSLNATTDGYYSCAACSPDSKHIVCGSSSGSIGIWGIQDGHQTVDPWYSYTGQVNSITYSPDGAYIVSGSGDKTVCIWDAKTGELVGQPLEGHTSPVRSVACSPDGKRIVSSSDDAVVRVWDMEMCVQSDSDPHHLPPAPLSRSLRDVQGIEPHMRHLYEATWTVNEDGWVTFDGSLLCVWLPPDLRIVLQRPYNTGMISRHGCLKLELDRNKLGSNWHEYFQPEITRRSRAVL